MNDSQQIGEIIGKLDSIKQSTDKIPDMLAELAVHKEKINQMMPKVEEHEKIAQRAMTLAGLISMCVGIISHYIGRNNGAS